MNSPESARWLAVLSTPGRRPGIVLLIATALALLSAWSVSRSHSSASIQDLLGTSDPAAAALGKVLETFPSAEELLLLVSTSEDSESDPEQGVPQLLAFAVELSRTLAESPGTAPLCRQVSYALSPEAMDFITHEAVPAGLMYLDEDEFRAMMGRLTPAAMREQIKQDEAMISAPGPAGGAIATTLMKDPLRLRDFLASRLREQGAAFRTWRGRPEYVSEDGRSVLIRVAGTRPPSDLAFAKLITARAAGVVNTVIKPGFTVEISGAYAIAAASERAIRADLTSSIIWSVVIMQGVFLVGYRNLLSFPLAFVPVALALALAFGLHALITPGFTPLTAAVGAMLIGCGIDYPVYFISYFEAARARGLPARAASEEALPLLAVPLIAACSTSVVGFVAIAASRTQALRDFAFLGGVGLAFALAGSVLVLPAMLMLADRVGWLGSAGPRLGIGRVIKAICARPRVFIGVCAIAASAAGASLAMTRGVGFESDLNVMHPQPNAPLETQRRIGEKFGAADTMFVYIEASDTELVTTAYRVHRALRAPECLQAGVAGSLGLPAFLPDPSLAAPRAAEIARLDPDRVLADFDAAIDESIFEPGAFTQYKDFLRILLTRTTGPTLETLAHYPGLSRMLVGSSRAGRRASVTLITLGREIQDDRSRDAAVTSIRRALKDIPGATLTGLSVVGYDVERSVRRDLPLVVGLAAGAVIILLLICLRSATDSALALVPVAFGLLCLLGYMSASGERFNLANTVAMPLLIGLGVDYGIFVVSMGQQAHRAGEGPEGVMGRLAASLHAMLLSAATNVIGFGSLVFTSTPAVRSLGRVISLGVVACVAGTLLMLAPIVVLRSRRRD